MRALLFRIIYFFVFFGTSTIAGMLDINHPQFASSAILILELIVKRREVLWDFLHGSCSVL